MNEQRLETASQLMMAFAERTGVSQAVASASPPAAQRRYLWTDAFAVCNFLGLARATGLARHRDLAACLIDAVHEVLARHRPDDARQGWLGGPDGTASAAHPTRAGLRIGKPLPERAADAPTDERLEWEQDGQYFHYLTRWMHALDQAARALDRPQLNQWARELADTAHRAFTDGRERAPRRMHWKMRIDLSAPLVASMGQHDPLDGLVTAWQLEQTARVIGSDGPSLHAAIDDYAVMTAQAELATADPLGLGGLLMDACRTAQLLRCGGGDPALLERLYTAALVGFGHCAPRALLSGSAERRLAFRELGLAIGLAAVERMLDAADEGLPGTPHARASLEALARFLPLRGTIEAFWGEPAHRASDTWRAHEDINAVMLATALVPEGVLDLHGLAPASRRRPL